MSIRRRITIGTSVAVAITVVAVALGSYVAASRQVLAPIDDSLLVRAELIGNVRPDSIPPGIVGDLIGRRGLLGRGPGDFDATYYQIILSDGETINFNETGGQDVVIMPVPDDRYLDPEDPTLRSEWVDGVHLRIVTVYQPDTDVYIQMGRPLTEADESLRRFAGMLALGVLLGVAVAAALGVMISRRAVQPIEDLRDAITGVAEAKDLDVRVATDGDDEVAEVARAFNSLLSELEQSKAQQVRLVRDAGHELRTPLTALRMNLEVLQRHDVSPDERAVMLDAANAEVEELSDLVAEVVDLATDRYEEEPRSAVDLGEVAASVAERTSRRTGREIRVDSDGSVVTGRRIALERAVFNIVSNADKWSPPDGDITIVVEAGSVAVSDDGSGFAPDDLSHVFERFYRADDARATPGSGLGLSIVQQIVDDHEGSVFARNRSGTRGAVVGFTIPLLDS